MQDIRACFKECPEELRGRVTLDGNPELVYTFLVYDSVSNLVLLDGSVNPKSAGGMRMNTYLADELPLVAVVGYLTEAQSELYDNAILKSLVRTPLFLKTRYSCVLTRTLLPKEAREVEEDEEEGWDEILVVEKQTGAIVMDGRDNGKRLASLYNIPDYGFAWMTKEEGEKWTAFIRSHVPE